ncbi:MAG: hypothetical protein L3V56_13935 [Candidatus Magnetoovum sp. WYHC-5]|nr:hypothetical protein [Candidatus Magnetoovum sp. WYHC-5]
MKRLIKGNRCLSKKAIERKIKMAAGEFWLMRSVTTKQSRFLPKRDCREVRLRTFATLAMRLCRN